jgi:DNA end-binding protein Ku
VAEHDEDDDVGPRSFWSGTITFGLVSIPVELYPAHRSQRVSLRMVAPDGTPLTRRYFCPKEERALDRDEIVRGYEIEKNQYVAVTDGELEKLAPDKTRDIDLRRFVPAADIDPMHFERAYYLTPGGNSTKAYRLLAATMEQVGRAGIATFVMRGKEYLVAILADNGILRAETLRFADEVRTPADLDLPEPQQPSATVVRKMEKAITALSKKQLDEGDLEDHTTERLLELVAKKERSGEGVVPAPEGEAGVPDEGVIDLMEVLKRSLQGGGAAEGRGPQARSNAKSGAERGRSAAARGRSAASGGARSSKAEADDRPRSAQAKDRRARAAKTGKAANTGKSGTTRGASPPAGLDGLSKDELYDRAKELDIPGRSAMSKQELIAAIARNS